MTEEHIKQVDTFLLEHGITFPYNEAWIHAEFDEEGNLQIQIDGSIKIKK